MSEDATYLDRLRRVEHQIRSHAYVCRVCSRTIDGSEWWTDSRHNAFPDRQSDSDFPYILHQACDVQPHTTKDRDWLRALAHRYAQSPLKPGQLVRIVRVPDDVMNPGGGAFDEDVCRAFELGLGHIFRIADIAEDGTYGLDVSERVGGWFGSSDEQLWVTDAEVKPIDPSDPPES